MDELGYAFGTILGFVFVLAITVLPSALLSQTLFKKLKILYQTFFSFGIVTIIILLFRHKHLTMQDHFIWWFIFLILTYFVNLRLDKEEWGKFMKKLYK